MIARIWRGETPESKADQYFDYLMATGLKDYRETKGNQGVLVLRRVRDGHAEFLLISIWESWDAIHEFAGDDVEKAVYYPEDPEYLLTLEPKVEHYEVLLPIEQRRTMAEQMDKASILDEMRTKYAALEDILAPLDETQMITEGVNGDWSIKDVLAHITAWQYRLLVLLHAATQNEEPAISGPDSDEEMDRLNEQFYKENKSRPLDDVLTGFRATYLQIVNEVEVLNEEDLTAPHRFTWTKGNPLWYAIAGDTYEHYEGHTESIQEWLVKSRQAL